MSENSKNCSIEIRSKDNNILSIYKNLCYLIIYYKLKLN